MRSIGVNSNTHTIDQDEQDENFLNLKEPPEDVDEQISQRTDGTFTQTQSSMTGFRNHSTVNAVGEQRELNFILFPETSRKTLISRSGFKVIIWDIPTDKLRSWSAEFPKCEGTIPAH